LLSSGRGQTRVFSPDKGTNPRAPAGEVTMHPGAKVRRLVFSFFLSIVGAAAGAAGEGAPPWEAQPFAAEPGKVLSAARAATAGSTADVVVLLEEGLYTFDERGRCDYRYHLVYLARTEAGARGWASLDGVWAPWHEERPVLRARVVTPEGQAFVLDPKTVGEVPLSDEDPDLLTDRKRLRAPLPGLKAGAVVEEEVRSVDREPSFAAGTQYRFYLGNDVPTRRVRVVIDAPESLPLHHVLRGAGGLTLEREREGGRVRLRLEAGPLDPAPAFEPWMPSDRPRGAFLAFSTGASWTAVAETYGRIVDAQVGVPSPATLRNGVRRDEVAARLLRDLHAEIRYTGLEFGEAAIVPRSPAEVLARKYGDCKDQAALLVSRLRAEGIPAHVALLSTGPGADVEPELPGIGSFDHAIVLVPGDPPLWIDPTDEFSRAGELPVSDQDRLVLVAAAGTRGLVRTPATESADNVLTKTREYHLAAGGHVVETTRATGWLERAYRSYLAHTEPQKVRESQEAYARSQHQTGEIVSSRNANPRDLATPFELTVESKRTDAGDTGLLSVGVDPSGLLVHLPDYVGATPENGGPSSPRKEPFVFYEPYRVEWTYRILPPSGAVVKRLPEPERLALGKASFESRFEAKPDGVVEGRLAFDSGPRQVDAAAFQQMHEAVLRLRERDPLTVQFEDRAVALAEAGKTCEALAELRRGTAQNPRSAEAQEKLALALLDAGFGEAARDAAARAVALDPSLSSAQRSLGWVLEHDALGRRFKPGWDRAGALAAYRKAAQLDPRNTLARESLAILLEHNDVGVHFGAGAELEEAVREEQGLRNDLGDTSLDVNLLLSLSHLRRFDELETVARTMPKSTNRDEMLVVAVGAQRGASEAAREASRLFADASGRRDALLHAGNSLVELRLYPEGAALLAQSAAGADDAADRRQRADLFARVRPYEELALDPADPRTPLKRLFILTAELFEEGGSAAELLEILEPGEDERVDPTDTAGFLAAMRRGMRAGAGDVQYTKGLVDVILSVAQFVADGHPDVGYRVRMVAGDRTQSAWVVRRGRTWKLVSVDFDPAVLALQAWRAVDKGGAAAAAPWLDWVREEMGAGGSDADPVAGPPFLQLWPSAGRRDATTVRVAAASLLGGSRAAQGVQTLEAWRAALTDPHAVFQVDRALLFANIRAGRWAAAHEVARRLLAAAPDSLVAWEADVTVLRRAGKVAEARALAESRLAHRPDDPDALRELAGIAISSGQYDEGERRFARLAEVGRAVPGDLNNRAWNAIFRGAVNDEAIEWGRIASDKLGASALHTLATLYAEKGRTAEAMQLLAKSIASTATDEPKPHDWYVVGRVAEQCGLADVARASYARSAADPQPGLDSAAVLARRGLERLGAQPVVAERRSPRR
jgi:tetratricopeptide (TPR) repeat protein